MKYNPSKHHRHSIRLKGYDYSSAGGYFVTAVLQHRVPWFGLVNKSEMQLSYAGKVAQQCWVNIPDHFPHTALDEFIIMPDHMHGIIFILEDENENGSHENSEDVQLRDVSGGGVQLNAPTEGNVLSNAPTKGNASLDAPTEGNALSNAPTKGNASLNAPTACIAKPNATTSTRKDNYFSIISPQKKSLSVIIRTYKAAVTTLCRLGGSYDFNWQRDYYEHIIRNEHELIAIRRYILNNPAHWHETKIVGV